MSIFVEVAKMSAIHVKSFEKVLILESTITPEVGSAAVSFSAHRIKHDPQHER